MRRLRFGDAGLPAAFAVLALSVAACRRSTPEPPGVTPGPVESVVGTERLGWSQRAADRTELSEFGYAVYVDDVRTELTGVDCTPSSTAGTFACSAPLPPMTDGMHTLQLAALVVDREVLESARSASLQVNKTSATTGSASNPATSWPDRIAVTTSDSLRLGLERIAQGLVGPTDIAFMPDGRTLVAEQSGRVRVVSPEGDMLDAPALSLGRDRSADIELLSLAADRRGFVYAVYVATSRQGSRAFTVSRFREAANVLVGEVVLLDGVDAPREGAAAAVRVDTDGAVFVAFDDGGNSRTAGDRASPNGKILRLNADGTTPADQAGFSPMYAAGARSPAGFDWQPATSVLWIADATSGRASISAVGATVVEGRKRGATLAAYTLPGGLRPSSVAFYRGPLIPEFQNNLLIASDEGQQLLRAKLDAAGRPAVSATERLLQGTIGGIRVVAANPNGTIYLATADSLAVLAPER